MNSGSYQLSISVRRPVSILVGSLGEVTFAAGDYVYTGSAMRNLAARVARHQKTSKKLRWHIDYLLNDPEVWITDIGIFPSENREECDRNLALIASGATVPVPRFGSSDCRRCPAHLVALRLR